MDLILHSIEDIVVFYDNDLRVQWANDAALKSIRETIENVIGKKCYELFGKESVCKNCVVFRAAEENRLCEGINEINGIILSTKAYPTFDKKGGLIGVLEVSEDITKNVEADRELRNIIESTNDGFWRWYADVDKLEWSERAYTMLGYRQNEFDISMEQLKTMIHLDDRKHFQKELEEIVLEGKFSAEFRLKAKNGKWHWVLSRGTVIRRAIDGTPLIIAGIHIDTNEKRNERSLLRKV